MSEARLRLDKWLWYARFFKSRSLAGKLCAAGKVRVNRVPVAKPHAAVKPTDVLTFPQGNRIRVIRILALGSRQGPAPEARSLYEDLAPPDDRTNAAATPRPIAAERPRGVGRPTKTDRRALDRLRGKG